ncbi:HAD hydrolase family protein [Kitasatospora sp. NPDC058965]|uniref:HAD hydrolase family protein n=1 Tax=Kitasatospora sp. NPDC058965 TaxID=3346682 RepID=UPI0036BC037C
MVDAQIRTSRRAVPDDHRPAAPVPVAVDPLQTVPELTERLLAEVERADWLEAYLAAAGATQILQDLLEGTDRALPRAARHLADRRFGALLRVLARLSVLLRPWRGRWALRRWCDRLAALTDQLADLVLVPGRADQAGPGLSAAARPAATGPAGCRALRRAVLRRPPCFAGFDQHPQDVAELVRRFAAQYPEHGRPLLVLGVRTSGSYLAPLAGAALRARGYAAVTVGTVRPHGPLLPGRRRTARRTARRGGAVLLLDAPPETGGSVAAVARAAERAGFPAAAVVPLLALFGAAVVPEALHRYPCVLLPGDRWAVRERLGEAGLLRTVAAVLPDSVRVAEVTAPAVGRPSRWAHLSVPVAVRVERADRSAVLLSLTAEWAGLGGFGRYRAQIAERLPGLVAPVLGFVDGVLLRERLPGEDRPGRPVAPVAVAGYLAQRRRKLALAEDRSAWLAGRRPVWEVAGQVLAAPYGRFALPARIALLDRLARRTLTVDHPCVTDGRTGPGAWAADGRGGWAKTDCAGGSSSHLDLAGRDAAFDLAGAALGSPEDEAALLARYRELTGDPLPGARWCLLQLVQAWNERRLAAAGALPAPAGERARTAQARAVRRFLADVYLADLPADSGGSGWVVLDVDGVLETDAPGFPASSPLGLLALRALRAHGYRTLLATGRSLPEVRERCADYGLSGGAAEYGCVGWDGQGELALLPQELREAGDGGLPGRIAALPGCSVDLRYLWCVRGRSAAGPGALDPRTVRQLLADCDPPVRYEVVPGEAQTDFVPLGADKGHGVRALLDHLGAPGAVPVLAVGDGRADLSMLRSAVHGRAPANGQRALHDTPVTVLRHAYQAGLAEAVAGLIGHPVGSCDQCRPPLPDDTARPLLALLAVSEDGRRGTVSRTARLVRAALRPDGPGERL